MAGKVGRESNFGKHAFWWANYVKVYEDLVVQNGWDIFEETYWVEFLTFRLEGEARKIFENWTLEDPSIRGDYQKVKKSFPGKFGVEDNVWKRMSDYELCRMKPDETISDNV